ncbi:MAG: retroviral-like aspartic protease family protein [Chroococcidiopsidaceae cyanobacterium CP_BM_RX_35]|nr:retroviral-like aspartic protease family protein [Chroococcidiopsidaceae cyanobacterium CP_BM_RX_35]
MATVTSKRLQRYWQSAIMLKRSVFYITITLVSTTIGLLCVACSNHTLKQSTQLSSQGSPSPSTTPNSGNAQPATTVTATALASPDLGKPAASVPKLVEPNSGQPDYYELAQSKAYSAWSTSQFAHSSADWHLVALQWQEAITLLQALPAGSLAKALAQTKIAEYQHQLTYAQQQATNLNKKDSDNHILHPPVQLSQPTVLPNQIVFKVPIRRLAGGTPVIDVTFNDTQQVEMIVDTGASGTVITQQTATALRIVPVTKAKANTASAKAVEFPVGYVNSVAVGGLVIKHLPVAIAPSAELEIGLLGHDFFGDYDVTIKRNVVEFRTR